MIGGKSKFTLQRITNHAFHYRASTGNLVKQNFRYVERVLEQYANLKSFNPGHYANITHNGPYILALIQLYDLESQKPKQ
jgi:hypothetical protein